MATHQHRAPEPVADLDGVLTDPRLPRYLTPSLTTRINSELASPRTAFEVLAQLASARYTIGTYLPRKLISRQTSAYASGPWLEWTEGSLLFADVSGSTALAERLTVLGREGIEIVTGALNEFFDTMIRIIQAAGGDLLTFGGDALLVLFSGSAHAQVATRAALDLLAELSGFERSVPGIGTFSMSMHIGVESGRVALASAGQPDELRYSAFGNTVNSVARAEGYGGRGELVVGPHTWAAIAAHAEGAEVAPGYVRVHSLSTTPLTPALPADETSSSTLPEQAIPELLDQLERLSPYLPGSLLTRIVLDPQRPQVEADLRPVTVLFAQFTGVGPLVEQLAPAEAATLVNSFLCPLQLAVRQFGGFVNKLDLADEGDKLLAIFGAPVAYEDHAERAARAALAMLEAAEHTIAESNWAALGLGHVARQLGAIRIRIGLNTGSVFAGNVGTATRKEYTVMGDAVNVAARVMSKTEWGQVWCSATTAGQINERLECIERERVRVKGKNEPLQLLQVSGERSQNAAPLKDDTPLIGRQSELDWLCEHFTAARAGQGRTVRIIGEAGVGKSRLTAALLDKARAAEARIIHITCLSFANNTPFAPWGEWLKEVCGIVSGDPRPARAEKLGAALAALPGDQRDWLPLLADMVRLDVEDNVVTRSLDAQQRQARRFELIAELLRYTVIDGGRWTVDGKVQPDKHGSTAQPPASSSPSPAPSPQPPASLLILFEDLHWADQISLDLWQYVGAAIKELPVLLLGVHRPGLNWGSDGQSDDAYELQLGELSLSDSEALISARLGDLELPAGVREQIVARAGGNPLFIEEILRAVRAAGKEITAAALEQLPDSLNGLLLARIDRLDEQSRALLRVASVIGQRFPFDILTSLQPADQQSLMRNLIQLDEEAMTLLERELPERVHTFRHAMIQEVAYQSLLYSRRRELHRRIGEYLERRYANELAALERYYGSASPSADPIRDGREGSVTERSVRTSTTPLFLVAHHYRLSDQHEKAVAYLLLAGHAAREAYANDEAIHYYRQVLEALREALNDPRIWEAREALGDVLCTIGDYDGALTEYAAILTTAVLPPAIAIEALRSRGFALTKQGQYHTALDELTHAEALIQANLATVPPLLVSAVYADMASVLFYQGEFDRAVEVCTAGLSKLRRDRRTREDEHIEARLHTQVGMIYGVRGDYTQARFHFESALAAHEAIDNLYGSSVIHNNLGYLAQLQSNFAEAVGHYELVEELARKISAKYLLSSAYLNSAFAHYFLGHYDQAEAGCQDALQLCEEMRDQVGIASAYNILGLVKRTRGDYSAALDFHERALVIQRESGNASQQSNILTNIAFAYNAMECPEQAIAPAEEALAIAVRMQAAKLEVEALQALAEIDLLLAGRPGVEHTVMLSRGAERAAQALARADELDSPADSAAAHRLLGIAAATAGSAFDEHFQTSINLYDTIKDRFEQARSEAAYGKALAARNLPTAGTYLKRAEETFRTLGAHGELVRLYATMERNS